MLELPTTKRSKVYSSVPGRKREGGSFLAYLSFSSSLRTTTSRSSENRSYRAFLMSFRYRETTISRLKSVGT